MASKNEILAALGCASTKRLDDVPAAATKLAPLFIRRLTAGDRDRLDLYAVNHASGEGYLKEGTKFLRALTVSLGWCDDQGKRLFADNELKQVDELDGEVIDWLYDQVRTYNGIGSRAKDVEDEAKNSEMPATS